jgi:glycosyltransferase involved in cell wall biosynthesis
MKILVIGHSYVVDSNRQFWNQASISTDSQVDMIIPAKWKSNLIKSNEFRFNPKTDLQINKIFPIPVYFNGNGSAYYYHWIKFFKVLLTNKYDSIFIFQETWALSLFQLIILKILTKNMTTKIHIAVCQNIIKKKLSWVIPWERFLMLFVKRIWFCTYEILSVLKWKKISNSHSYLPFTYDQNIYEARVKHLNSDTVKLGFIGRLTEEKGIRTLVLACRNLIKNGYKIELHLAGGGLLQNEFKDSFIIFHGLIPHIEAHLFYQKIDILILPSLTTKFWKEQFGRVLVESTASGTPVVGSSSGAIPEVIGKIGFGEVFQENNESDLESKIIRLIEKMKLSNYDTEMANAIKNTYDFSSHEQVSINLIEQMKNDIKI